MNDHTKPAITVKAWPYPTLFAHRGGGSLAPENTLAAMQCGYANGYGAVEFDVKLSADNIAFLLHDDTLDRTTNGFGAAAQMNMADLEKLDAGAWHSTHSTQSAHRTNGTNSINSNANNSAHIPPRLLQASVSFLSTMRGA